MPGAHLLQIIDYKVFTIYEMELTISGLVDVLKDEIIRIADVHSAGGYELKTWHDALPLMQKRGAKSEQFSDACLREMHAAYLKFAAASSISGLTIKEAIVEEMYGYLHVELNVSFWIEHQKREFGDMSNNRIEIIWEDEKEPNTIIGITHRLDAMDLRTFYQVFTAYWDPVVEATYGLFDKTGSP